MPMCFPHVSQFVTTLHDKMAQSAKTAGGNDLCMDAQYSTTHWSRTVVIVGVDRSEGGYSACPYIKIVVALYAVQGYVLGSPYRIASASRNQWFRNEHIIECRPCRDDGENVLIRLRQRET